LSWAFSQDITGISGSRQRLCAQSFPDTAEDLAKSDLFTGCVVI